MKIKNLFILGLVLVNFTSQPILARENNDPSRPPRYEPPAQPSPPPDRTPEYPPGRSEPSPEPPPHYDPPSRPEPSPEPPPRYEPPYAPDPSPWEPNPILDPQPTDPIDSNDPQPEPPVSDFEIQLPIEQIIANSQLSLLELIPTDYLSGQYVLVSMKLNVEILKRKGHIETLINGESWDVVHYRGSLNSYKKIRTGYLDLLLNERLQSLILNIQGELKIKSISLKIRR